MSLYQTPSPDDLSTASDGKVGRDRIFFLDGSADAAAIVVPGFIEMNLGFDLHYSSD